MRNSKRNKIHRNKLWWRCHRGTRELDVLLLYYMDYQYDQASPEEQNAFEEMLRWPDPELYAVLSAAPRQAQRQTGKAHIAHIVSLIHARYHTKAL